MAGERRAERGGRSTAIVPGADSRFRRLCRHAYVLPVGVLVLLAFIWMITRGTWRLTEAEPFGQFYDAQARSLLAGRWDVPPEAIGEEAFIRDGKTYGYFGFVPSLLRIPLNAALPWMEGRWTRLLMTVACAISLVYAYLLLMEARRCVGRGPRPGAFERVAYAAFMLSVGLGSTLIFLASRAYVFHEAVIWGAAFSLGCYYHLMCWLRRPAWGPLAVAGVMSFLAFFSRASVGSGAVLSVGFIAVGFLVARAGGAACGIRTGHAVAAAGAVLFTALVFVSVNRAKFGTWVEAIPLRFYYPMLQDPRRLARTGGRHMAPGNVRSGFAAYTSPEHLRVSSNFPWVDLAIEATVMPEARYHVIEPFTSATASMPALAVLALLGLTGLRRRVGAGGRAYVVLLGAAAGGATVLAANAVSERYLHDFFPLLVLSGAFGLHALLAFKTPFLRRAAWTAMAVLIAYGIYVNSGIALVYQRVFVWGVPRESRLEFLDWQERAREVLSAKY